MTNGKKIVIGNWKMYPETLAEARELFGAIKKEVKRIENVEVAVAPPAIYLGYFKATENDGMKLAGQNMHWEDRGAFTGEISPSMLKDAGAEYVIVGHSERRQYFGESDEMINRKIVAAFKNNITPILCIGETMEEKSAEKTHEIIKEQISKAMENISADQFTAKGIIVAYEPIWAIGTGLVPSFDDVLTINLLIKKILTSIYARESAGAVPILYGGSVNALNAKDFIVKGRMDGLLVGGASIKANEFISIFRQLNFNN